MSVNSGFVERINTKSLHRNAGDTFKRKAIPYAYISPTLLLILVLMIVPIAMVIGYSFVDRAVTETPSRFTWLDNYAALFTDGVYVEAIGNTFAFTIVSMVVHMALGMAFALILNTKSLSKVTKAIFRVVYILPWMFTAAIIAVMWKLILNPSGIVNYFLEAAGLISKKVEWLGSVNTAMFSVMLMNIWCGYPFYLVSLLAGLQGISEDLYEAATVDGANGIHKFLHITIPQLLPIIVSIAMMDFIWTMQTFGLVWMTTGGGPLHVTEMISTYTYKLAFTRYKFPLASASAVILLLFCTCLSLVYVKIQRARD